MKKLLTLTIIVIIALFLIATNVQATETIVEVSTAEQLSQELSNVAANGAVTIKLTDNINVTGFIVSKGETITIDLNGKKIAAQTLFQVNNGTVILKGNGVIETTEDLFYVDTTKSLGKAKVEIGANVKAISGYSGIYIKGANTQAHVYGSLTAIGGSYATIMGNGNITSAGTIINIYSGAEVISEKSIAIYHPQDGKLNIYGGTIKGISGIEMRAGKLVVEDGNIIATADKLTVKPNGNGATTIGAGIAIAQHNTKLETSVIVKGGNIQGFVALNENNTEGNDAASVEKVSIAITGGNFETTNGGTEAVKSETQKEFIAGGTFSSDVSDYVDGESKLVEVDGSYIFQTQLSKPTNLKWDKTTAKWEGVPNVKSYMVILYKGDTVVDVLSIEDTSIDLAKYLTDKTAKYNFAVCAEGDGKLYTDSQIVASDVYEFSTEEDKKEEPTAGGQGTAEAEKDETPATGSVDVVLFASAIVTVISVSGIVTVKKYTK